MNVRFVLYTDSAAKYRWRLRAANNEIIADSGQGYATKSACEQGIALVRRLAPTAVLVDITS